MLVKTLAAFTAVAFVAPFVFSNALAAPRAVPQKAFGTLANGQKVTLFTLTNSRGTRAEVLDYGGIVRSLSVRDRRGRMGDVVLGFDTLGEYSKSSPYFGCLTGRYANRIAKGQFSLDGKTYNLAKNNGPNHLHGGLVGFDKRVWRARPLPTNNGSALELRLTSPDGDQGYPGKLDMRVVYTLNNQNQFRVEYFAVTDAPTLCNLTQHSYFNLSAGRAPTILNHRMQLNANRFVPIDTTSIPLGPLKRVAGTPFDFRTPVRIGARIGQSDTQLKNGQGYDHNFVLNGPNGILKRAARVEEPLSGRVLTVYTTEPGLQLYSGNFLNGLEGKAGRVYARRSGFALEAQKFPDSPNRPNFPSSVLRPGQTYRQTTIYAFSVR